MKSYEPSNAGRTDWKQLANDFLTSALFGTLMTSAFRALRAALDEKAAQQKRQSAGRIDDDIGAELADDDEEEAREAATLLGVDVDSSEREVRAALRAHLTLSRLHPDHGGDHAKTARLLDARNLLIERARARVATPAPR